ncbi:MAG: DoxX family protein [Phycisphaerales bacterium]|nr:DoxX family protein [Phycisphaerales bacterium]MCB9835983.1 DoxX family protein [Phycisphaera sp.]
MSFRTTLALNVAPLCLRLALAGTFMWAGISKVAYRTEISDPNDIAQLVEWNIVPPQSAAVPAPPLDNPETVQPKDDPAATPPADESNGLEDVIDNLQKKLDAITPDDDQQVEENQPADDLPPDDPAATDSDEGDEVTPVEDGGNALPVAYQSDQDSVEVKRVMRLALLIHHAANPGVNNEGQPLTSLWPDALAKGTLPVVFAWVAAILELVCGAAMLIGFFTRLASLPLAGTMLTAMWLTQIGPAIQSGNTLIGFLPTRMFDESPAGYVYATILWQFALLMSALAMFFIGPGALSIDRLIFGAPSTRFDEPGGKRQVEFVPMGE